MCGSHELSADSASRGIRGVLLKGHFQPGDAGGHCLTKHAHSWRVCTGAVVCFLTFNPNMDPAATKRQPFSGDIYVGLPEMIS